MATTENYHAGDASKTKFSFTFPYLKQADVEVYLYETSAWVKKTITTHYTFANATTITFGSAPAAATTAEQTNLGNNKNIKIKRNSSTGDTLAATFYPGSAIRAGDLNDNFTQNLYVTQEVETTAATIDDKLAKTGGTMTGPITMGEDQVILFEGATANDYETTLTVADPTADRTITLPNITGTVITTGDTGTVTSTMLATDSVDSAELVNGSVDLAHMSVNSIDSDQYVDGSIDHVHLANDIIDGDNIQDDVINSEHYAAASIDNEHLADNAVNTDKIADGAVSFAKLKTADVDISSDTWSSNSDVKIASVKAINNRILDIVEDVGGFVPIANETSFPDTNPDPEDGTGTLVSIKALASNLVSNGSGVATIANGNVSNNATVTINGLANSTTYIAGNGMLVETTAVLHTYTFHRELASAANITSVANNIANVNIVAGDLTYAEDLGLVTESVTSETVGSDITTVATNINDINSFSDIYRVASSAPSSSLDEGDLWYDSTNNILKYYNSSAWVATTGITSLLDDQSPELYAALDCNDKNLTDVATVSGTNLQIDFGTL